MKHVNELRETLTNFLDWHKPRLDCLIYILQGLFLFKSVNLVEIATGFKTKAKKDSAVRRISRFFTDFNFDISAIIPLVLRLFPLEGKFLLIVDRTNWKWGKTPINILMLSIAYRGISIPILWAALNVEGNSCLDDRVSLLDRFVKLLGVEKIEALLADREFIGKKWFRYLVKNRIPFLIRIKQNSMVHGLRNGYSIPIRELCKELGHSRKILNRKVTLWEQELHVSIRRRKKAKEPLIVASNVAFKDPLQMYKRRWEIETMFGCLKTRGFRMEDTHMTDPDKIEKLLFVLAVAFCWAYRVGDLRSLEKPIPVKSHGRIARSLFREGLDMIRYVITEITFRIIQWKKLLSCFEGTHSRFRWT